MPFAPLWNGFLLIIWASHDTNDIKKENKSPAINALSWYHLDYEIWINFILKKIKWPLPTLPPTPARGNHSHKFIHPLQL